MLEVGTWCCSSKCAYKIQSRECKNVILVLVSGLLGRLGDRRPLCILRIAHPKLRPLKIVQAMWQSFARERIMFGVRRLSLMAARESTSSGRKTPRCYPWRSRHTRDAQSAAILVVVLWTTSNQGKKGREVPKINNLAGRLHNAKVLSACRRAGTLSVRGESLLLTWDRGRFAA
jgi:hypothetical protein